MLSKSPSTTIWGRDPEIKRLNAKNWRSHAELIVIYGRRRVGKTTLVEAAYKNTVLWKFEGLENESLNKQIQNFLSDLATYTKKPDLKSLKIKNWRQAFEVFIEQLNPDQEMVVFFDEFQWLADMKSSFVSLFKYFWDNHFQKFQKMRFVLCGSVSSFMVKKVLRSKSLYGRVDTEIDLKPLTLADSENFFEHKRTRDEVLHIHMVLGGIPKYLEELNPELSFIQNLNHQAFSQNGYFFKEYRRLFISHFSESPLYEKIIHHLSQKIETPENLARACNTKTGGSFSEKLKDLEWAGFIKKYSPLDKGPKSKLLRYCLFDEYLQFYNQFILPNVSKILSGQISVTQLTQKNLYKQWLGFAFERLCLKHAQMIAKTLEFSGIEYHYGPWFQRNSQRVNAQIDLAFERADHVLTVCELKHSTKLVGQKVIENFEKKLQAIQESYPRYSLQKVLILGKESKLPQKITQYFDRILWATDALFD